MEVAGGILPEGLDEACQAGIAQAVLHGAAAGVQAPAVQHERRAVEGSEAGPEH